MSWMPCVRSTPTCSPAGWPGSRSAGGAGLHLHARSGRPAPRPAAHPQCRLAGPGDLVRGGGANGGECWPRAAAAWTCSTCICRRSEPPSWPARWPPPRARSWRAWCCGTPCAAETPGCSWNGASACGPRCSAYLLCALPRQATWSVTSQPCAPSPRALTAFLPTMVRHSRCGVNAADSRPSCASASCTLRHWRRAMPIPSLPLTCWSSWGTPICWNSLTSTASSTPS